MTTKSRILAVLIDNKPLSCQQVADKLDTHSKVLAVHLLQLTESGRIFRLDGLKNRRPHYYSLAPFSSDDVPAPRKHDPNGKIRCRACGDAYPATSEYFFKRSCDPIHAGTAREFKVTCKACTRKLAAKLRLTRQAGAGLLEAKRIKREASAAELAAAKMPPKILRERNGNSTRVVFTDTWRPFREERRFGTPGFLGYSSPLAGAYG